MLLITLNWKKNDNKFITSAEIKKRAKLTKLKRAAHPSEIATIIDHLISDDINYMTGEVIIVSGGDWL